MAAEGRGKRGRRLPRRSRQRRSPEGRRKARSAGAGRAGSQGGEHGCKRAAAAGGRHRAAPSLRPPLAPRWCPSAGAAPWSAAGRDPSSERRLAAGNVTAASRRTLGVVVGAAAPQLLQRRGGRRRSPRQRRGLHTATPCSASAARARSAPRREAVRASRCAPAREVAPGGEVGGSAGDKMVGCANLGGGEAAKPWRGSLGQPPGTLRAGELSDPALPAAPSPVALPGQAPGGGDERRGDTGTRTPRAESLSRRLLRRARSGEGHRGRRGKGGGQAPPWVFRAQAAGAARTFPFFGIGAGGAGYGSCESPLPPAPSPPRDAAGAA
ncbi:hypothetical protein Nmel_002251 [Mimus melanotis]